MTIEATRSRRLARRYLTEALEPRLLLTFYTVTAFADSGVAQFVGEGLAESFDRDQQLAGGALIDLADGGLRQRLRRSTRVSAFTREQTLQTT